MLKLLKYEKQRDTWCGETLAARYRVAIKNAQWRPGGKKTGMSLADHIFIDMCKDVIENGTSTEGEKVRPVWEDGTSAYTIKRFGVVNRYDLRKNFQR